MRTQLKCTILMAIVFFFGSQSFPGEGNKIAKDEKPRIIVDIGGIEAGALIEIQKFIRLGVLKEALKQCDEILLRDPQSKYIRLERVEIYKRMKEPAEMQRDLDYLLQNYPDFGAAYQKQARLFLDFPLPEKGDHPLIEWLRSTDHHKRDAALDAVQELIMARTQVKK
jgi:hypothetical protein